MTKTETIMIPFIDPGLTVLESYPHKIVIESDHLEIFTKAKVEFDDDDTGLKQQGQIDQVRMVIKKNVSGVEIYRGKKYQLLVLRIACIGFQDDSDIYFTDMIKAKEVYLKIKNWILNENS